MRAAAPSIFATSARPSRGPRTDSAVARPSATPPCGAITVTLDDRVSGAPVRGSRMCEYRTPPISMNCSASPDVEIAASRSMADRGGSASPGRLATSTVHAFAAGGAPSAKMSPPSATSALPMPARVSTAAASSAAKPFPIPPRSSCMPERRRSTVRSASSSSIRLSPVSASAVCTRSGSGSAFSRRARRQRCVSGPAVTSNAPPLSAARRCDRVRARNRSSLTRTGPVPARRHSAISSLSSR